MSTRQQYQPNVQSQVIYGSRVLGTFKEPVRAEEIASITCDATTEAHLMRHFSSLPEAYLSTLRGKPFRRYDLRLGQHVPAILDDAAIARLLATQGSKFFAHSEGVATPRDVFNTAIEHCLAAPAAEVRWLDKGDRDIAYYVLAAAEPIGTQNVVRLASVPETVRRSRVTGLRGTGGDAIVVNLVKMHPPKSNHMVIMLQRNTQSCRLETAYPGIVVTDLPQPAKQTPEELLFCQRAWQDMAFVTN